MAEDDKEAEALLSKMREEFLQYLDDAVDYWHDSPYDDGPLQEYLGFTDEEYQLFMNTPEELARQRYTLEVAKTFVRWRKEAMESGEKIYYPLRKKK